jgi:hypothetical protein
VTITPAGYRRLTWRPEAGPTAFEPRPQDAEYFGRSQPAWKIDFPERVFLSLDPGKVSFPGCTLAATIVPEPEGRSDPQPLGRVIRLPKVEQLSLSNEKTVAAGGALYHRHMMRSLIVCLLAFFTLAAQSSEEKAVLAVAQQVFDGMAAKDAVKILAAMTPGALLYGLTPAGAPRATPADQWANRIASSQSKFVERFTKQPVVSIHGTIANVWGEYEFLRDGNFGHCGVDSFNLLKTAEGWKVAAIFDTEESAGCPGQR